MVGVRKAKKALHHRSRHNDDASVRSKYANFDRQILTGVRSGQATHLGVVAAEDHVEAVAKFFLTDRNTRFSTNPRKASAPPELILSG